MGKFMKYVAGVVMGVGCFGMTAFAENSITETDAVLYSNAETVVYAEADLNSGIVLDKVAFPDNAPVHVTGITSNGFFRINLNGTYYVAGNGLQNVVENVIDSESIAPTVEERIRIDLGYGIIFDSPRYIDDYYLDIYLGTIEISDAKIISKNKDSMPDVFGFGNLGINYSPKQYGVFNGEKQTAFAVISYLDKDGFEIGKTTVSICPNENMEGKIITRKTLIPKHTAAITVRTK